MYKYRCSRGSLAESVFVIELLSFPHVCLNSVFPNYKYCSTFDLEALSVSPSIELN